MLAGDLRSYLEGRVVAAYQTGAVAELKMWVRRNRSLARSLVAGVRVLVAGVVTSTYYWNESSEQAASVLRLGDARFGVEEYIVDMCAYGLTGRDGSGRGWVRRPTRFITNAPEIGKELQLRCPGGHRHATIPGG